MVEQKNRVSAEDIAKKIISGGTKICGILWGDDREPEDRDLDLSLFESEGTPLDCLESLHRELSDSSSAYLRLSDGTEIRFKSTEDSVFCYESPIAVLMVVNFPGESDPVLYQDTGVYLSWDSEHWDQNWTIVKRKVQMVEEIHYEKI